MFYGITITILNMVASNFLITFFEININDAVIMLLLMCKHQNLYLANCLLVSSFVTNGFYDVI